MPNVPYQTYTREQWQQILVSARQNHDQAAVQDAVNALNQYQQESVDATRTSSVGPELGAVGHGLWNGVVGIPGGIKTIFGQLRQGDVGGAAHTVLGGLGQMGKNVSGAIEVGADALDPRPLLNADTDYMPESERLKLLEGGASTLPALGLARTSAGPIKRGIGRAVAAVGKPLGGIGGALARIVAAAGKPVVEAGEEAETAGGAATEAAQQGTAGASPAGATTTPSSGLGGRLLSDAEVQARRASRQPQGQDVAPNLRPAQFETDLGEGQPLNPVSPSRFIGPTMQSSDIASYLQQIVGRAGGAGQDVLSQLGKPGMWDQLGSLFKGK